MGKIGNIYLISAIAVVGKWTYIKFVHVEFRSGR